MLFLKGKKDINEGLKRYQSTPGAVLLDVRTPSECSYGVVPGSINLPLHKIKSAKKLIPDLSTPVFAYCASGARADRAVKRLRRMGFENCESIGGISGFRGTLSK